MCKLVERLSRTDIEAVLAYADGNMVLQRAADKLHYDPRSIIYHFDKTQRETGLNPRDFYDLYRLVEAINEWKGEINAGRSNLQGGPKGSRGVRESPDGSPTPYQRGGGTATQSGVGQRQAERGPRAQPQAGVASDESYGGVMKDGVDSR